MTKHSDRSRRQEPEHKKKLAKQRPEDRSGSPRLSTELLWTYGPGILYRCGPLLLGRWLVPQVIADALVEARRPVPASVIGALLLDTGATNTCISNRAANDLGLIPTRVQDGFGAGGRHRNPVYLARLEMTIADEKAQQTFGWEQEVQGIPDLEKHAPGVAMLGEERAVVGLLGRDILRHARFLYDGPAGSLSFTFEVASLQHAPSRL
ncbi:MAG TPA: hypothetical protein VEZ11_17850 [Thermoanaerobaculia bacterium]|nr:hypothetical protein [Thermoanaerobaculia bacterium]